MLKTYKVAAPLSILLIAALPAMTACNRQAQDQERTKKDNILRDYIETPIDRAKAVSKQADEHNQRLQDALKEDQP